MLSADSYTLPRRRSGRRRWVKLRVHTRRLANIGANAAELRGLLGGVARLFSWVGFLGVLLWGLVQRVAGRIYRFGCGLLDELLESPAFGLTFDVGHNHCKKGQDEPVIMARKDKLYHMHLHDAFDICCQCFRKAGIFSEGSLLLG